MGSQQISYPKRWNSGRKKDEDPLVYICSIFHSYAVNTIIIYTLQCLHTSITYGMVWPQNTYCSNAPNVQPTRTLRNAHACPALQNTKIMYMHARPFITLSNAHACPALQDTKIMYMHARPFRTLSNVNACRPFSTLRNAHACPDLQNTKLCTCMPRPPED